MKARLPQPTLLVRIGLVGLLLAFSVTGWSAPNRDMRVVIDTSGSMKKSDPDNLRVPALRLFTELLGSGTEAGVWTFGQWTNMLVRHGTVDPRWKEMANREAAKIGSVALFTDIGQALETASRGWRATDAEKQRVLILLTDGRVDISKEPEKNTIARQHLLGPVLERMRALGVKLYPIGLSDNVDRELLEVLAGETGGLFQTAGSADDLYRIFINILEASTQANTLPIREGGFMVDASVEELNIVVFRARAEQRIALRDPTGKELDKEAAGRGLRWHEEPDYAVVTIPGPGEGRWRILTEPHPDNRVFVVSDLRIEAGDIPPELFAGEEVALQLTIADGDKPLADEKLLGLMQVQAALEHENGEEIVFELQRLETPRRERNAQFGGRATFHHEAGLASALLTAEGPTFHRSVRRIVSLNPRLLNARWQGPSFTGAAAKLELESTLGDAAGAPIAATVLLEGPGVTRAGFETEIPVGGRQVLLFAPEHEGRYTARVAALTATPSGREVLAHLPPLVMNAVPKPVEKAEPPRILIPAPEPLPAPPERTATGGIGGKWLAVAGIANLILLLGAFTYYRMTCRRESRLMDRRLAELEFAGSAAHSV